MSVDEKISSNQSRCRWILCEGINKSRYKLMVFTLCFRPCDLSQHQGERRHLVRGPGPLCQAVETTTLTAVFFKTNLATTLTAVFLKTNIATTLTAVCFKT